MKSLLKVILLVVCLYSCKQKETERQIISEPAKQEDTLANVLAHKIPKWQKELNVPNVGVGIIDNAEIRYLRVFDDKNETAPKDMLFNIASITKVLFGTTVMKLVNNGDWNLDEPLYTYHVDEDVKNDPRHKRLTSRHVLSQQSGFVNWRSNHPTEKLVFDFEPGTAFNYSGEGMEYLRLSIEKKFNKPWGKMADSLLFKPLQMDNTTHSWDGKTNIERFSMFYDAEGKQHILDDYSTTDNAADDIVTTVEDVLKFGIHVLNTAGLDESVYQEMITKEVAISDNQDQALGWRLIRNLGGQSNSYAIHHGGNDIGVATLLVLLPEKKQGVVVFTNGDSGIVMCNNIVREVFPEGKEIIHRAYRSGSVNDIPSAIKVEDGILESYTGVYEQPSGRRIEIVKTTEHLLMKMPGVPNFQLYPESESLFFLLDFDPKIEFNTTNNHGVTLTIIEGKNSIVCKKIK